MVIDLRKFVAAHICLCFGVFASAEEVADSVRTDELKEVVQEASPTFTTYTPTAKQKTASQNALDLLRQLAIPQIQINPIENAVTDNAGEEVAIFINYLPAAKEEMEGLRTADVRRVEYLEFKHRCSGICLWRIYEAFGKRKLPCGSVFACKHIFKVFIQAYDIRYFRSLQ